MRFFTAPVLDEPAALSRQTLYLEALRAVYPNVLTITEGRYQTKEVICRKCGDARKGYEEKETDVNIAVSLVADTARQLSDAAMVVSADSDLIPAIRTARELNPNLFIAAAFPPARFSAHIKTLLPASLQIGQQKISQAQFPQAVTDPLTGRVFTRPTKWQ